MKNFTIHIFGYGETQINSKDLSVKVATDILTTVTPLLVGVFAKKPADNSTIISDFHAVNFFGYDDIRWISTDSFDNVRRTFIDSFDVKDDEELKPLIDALIAELETKTTTTTTTVV